MTTRLYYQDQQLAEAAVTAIEIGRDGKGDYAILDQTCFYPEGGGQPADTGTIGDATVLDVQTVEGEIHHYTEQPLERGSYKARINWDRRFDHMQQHAGQHVLSAVFDDGQNMKTTSFHLGVERVSIDLNAPDLTAEQLEEAETAANAVIRQHMPITTKWVTDQQAAGMALRKPPAVTGDIRLVQIDGVDLNACGGTHPQNTADIGLIKIIGTEKAKGGTRVYFLCGERAMGQFQFLTTTADELGRLLNAPASELTEAASALLHEKASLEKEIKEMRLRLLEAEAATIVNSEEQVIERVFENRSIKEIQQLARFVVAQAPAVKLLFLIAEEKDIRFVCAKGKEASGDMREILQKLLALADGKGGGNTDFVQGGGTAEIAPQAYIKVFRESI